MIIFHRQEFGFVIDTQVSEINCCKKDTFHMLVNFDKLNSFGIYFSKTLTFINSTSSVTFSVLAVCAVGHSGCTIV